jgi:hypothetical protein
MDKQQLITELADSYELALSVGTSLVLEENCQNFFRSLLQRKNLAYASLWTITEEAVELTTAFPKIELPSESVDKEFAIALELEKHDELQLYSISGDACKLFSDYNPPRIFCFQHEGY